MWSSTLEPVRVGEDDESARVPRLGTGDCFIDRHNDFGLIAMQFGGGNERIGRCASDQLTKTCTKPGNVCGGVVFTRNLIELCLQVTRTWGSGRRQAANANGKEVSDAGHGVPESGYGSAEQLLARITAWCDTRTAVVDPLVVRTARGSGEWHPDMIGVAYPAIALPRRTSPVSRVDSAPRGDS